MKTSFFYGFSKHVGQLDLKHYHSYNYKAQQSSQIIVWCLRPAISRKGCVALLQLHCIICLGITPVNLPGNMRLLRRNRCQASSCCNLSVIKPKPSIAADASSLAAGQNTLCIGSVLTSKKKQNGSHGGQQSVKPVKSTSKGISPVEHWPCNQDPRSWSPPKICSMVLGHFSSFIYKIRVVILAFILKLLTEL